MSDAAAPLDLAPSMDADAFAELAGANAAQMADLERFRELLADWNARMNLVGPATLSQFWPRHAWDSAQLLRFAPEARTWADLGAGAGFPGLSWRSCARATPISTSTSWRAWQSGAASYRKW